MVIGSRRRQIDHHTATHRALFKIRRRRQRLGHDAGGEAKVRIVEDRQRVLVVFGADHAGDRRKELFAIDRHVVVGIDKQRGRHVEAGSRHIESLTAAE